MFIVDPLIRPSLVFQASKTYYSGFMVVMSTVAAMYEDSEQKQPLGVAWRYRGGGCCSLAAAK